MRKSNIELLRIISMFLIVLHHFSVHGVWPDAGPLSSDVAVWLLSFGGKLGVDVFVLITGYFSIRSVFKMRSILRVAGETWFYSSVLLLIFALTGTNMSPDGIAKALLPISSGEYWFVTNYIALMLVSPFINLLYAHLSPAGCTKLIIVGFVVLSVFPTFTTFNPVASNFIWFIYLYLLGGQIRNTLESNEVTRLNIFNPATLSCRYSWRLAFVSLSIVWGSIVVIGYSQGHFAFNVVPPKYLIAQNMIPICLAAAGILTWFVNLEIPSSLAINNIAKTVFGIYLIHDNPLVRHWLWQWFSPLYDYGWTAILAGGIVSAVLVFLVCAVLDALRLRFIERPFFSLIDKLFTNQLSRVDNWSNDISVNDSKSHPLRA